MIPLFKVFMADDVESFVMPVLRSGYIGEGPKVAQLEREFGEYIGNPNVVATNSGTSALLMALRLAGVGHGDRVISTPQTCLATNTAILSLGAVPMWADILDDGTIDPDSVQRVLNDWVGPRPRAIMCVDWGGTPCKVDELKAFGLPVIEDACQSVGSRYNGRHVGSDAHYACFSTQAIKHLTTGDGGFLVVNTGQGALADARLMKWFGLDRTKSTSMRCEQDPPLLGHKFQMNDIAASIGLANIRHLPEIIATTKRHAEIYDTAFKNSAVVVPASDPDRQSGYWLYTVSTWDAAHFIRYMGDAGVECGKAHTRNDTKTLFRQCLHDFTHLPGVSSFDRHHVCIPVGWWLTDDDVDRIVSLVANYR